MAVKVFGETPCHSPPRVSANVRKHEYRRVLKFTRDHVCSHWVFTTSSGKSVTEFSFEKEGNWVQWCDTAFSNTQKDQTNHFCYIRASQLQIPQIFLDQSCLCFIFLRISSQLLTFEGLQLFLLKSFKPQALPGEPGQQGKDLDPSSYRRSELPASVGKCCQYSRRHICWFLPFRDFQFQLQAVGETLVQFNWFHRMYSGRGSKYYMVSSIKENRTKAKKWKYNNFLSTSLK